MRRRRRVACVVASRASFASRRVASVCRHRPLPIPPATHTHLSQGPHSSQEASRRKCTIATTVVAAPVGRARRSAHGRGRLVSCLPERGGRDVGGKGGLEAVGGGGLRGTQKTPPFEMLFPCGPTRRRMPLVDSGRRVLVRRERRDGSARCTQEALTSPCCSLRSSRLRPKKREKATTTANEDVRREREKRTTRTGGVFRGGSAGGSAGTGRGEGSRGARAESEGLGPGSGSKFETSCGTVLYTVKKGAWWCRNKNNLPDDLTT